MVSTKFLQWFRRRCDNDENQRWLPAAIFVNRPEPFSGMHNYTAKGTSQANFAKNPTSGLSEDAITRLLQCLVKGK